MRVLDQMHKHYGQALQDEVRAPTAECSRFIAGECKQAMPFLAFMTDMYKNMPRITQLAFRSRVRLSLPFAALFDDLLASQKDQQQLQLQQMQALQAQAAAAPPGQPPQQPQLPPRPIPRSPLLQMLRSQRKLLCHLLLAQTVLHLWAWTRAPSLLHALLL